MHISYKALTYVNSARTGGQLAMTANYYVYIEDTRSEACGRTGSRGPL